MFGEIMAKRFSIVMTDIKPLFEKQRDYQAEFKGKKTNPRHVIFKL